MGEIIFTFEVNSFFNCFKGLHFSFFEDGFKRAGQDMVRSPVSFFFHGHYF